MDERQVGVCSPGFSRFGPPKDGTTNLPRVVYPTVSSVMTELPHNSDRRGVSQETQGRVCSPIPARYARLRQLLSLTAWLFLLLAALLPATASGGVVINEIFYNAPDDLEDLEYIELHNSGDQPVDLSGWAFTKGIKFRFVPGARLEPKGFLVVCRNLARFKEIYGAPAAGVFNQALSNKGEQIELSDAQGKVVDKVKYQDSPPWPMGPDGFSGSLERICPDENGEAPSNWVSSPLSEDRIRPAGTPGKANAGFSANLPPAISNVKFTPEIPSPNQPITVEADVYDADGLGEINLLYRLAGPGFEKPESALPMKKISETRYTAAIPGQPAGQLIRFRVQAADAKGARRYFPAETEPRPALSSYVRAPMEPAKVPFGWIINTTEAEFKSASQLAGAPGRGGFDRFMFGGGRRGGPGGQDGRGPGGPGGFGGARGGGPVRIGFGPGMMVGPQMMAQADKNEDRKLTQDELTALAAAWFDKLDPDRTGKLSQEQFVEKLSAVLPPPQGFGPPGDQPQGADQRAGGGRGGFGPALFFGPGLFAATDTNKDGSLTREELKATFEGWFGNWDNDKTGFLDEAKVIEGLNTALPQPQFGGPGGPGGPGGRGPGGFGGRGGFEPPRFGGFGRGGPFGFRGGNVGTASHRSAFVYLDPETGKLELFDFVQVVPRRGGQKVHFYKDRPLNQMTTINLIFENDRAVLAEPLAFDTYRRAGVAAPLSFHLRLWQNGQLAGYYLLNEQVNRAFLRRNKLPDDGNLYKILWYERGVVGQHEKKTNLHGGHDDVVALIDQLEKTNGDEEWELIKKHFDVEQVVNYFAVSMALSNWDGFFNNYFTYHDLGKNGKWTMFPWDEDQTWGITMGFGSVFYDMPITFGMEGDRPPGQRESSGRGRGFGFGFGGGGAMWWRAPGWFSGPLLANPQFRKIFLARTKEILETIYTEEVFLPIIDAIGERLRPEIKLRAESAKDDPVRALESFEQNLAAFREHLKKRREFLLAQDEIKGAGKYSKADFESAPPR
ncbi:MAG: CotH kinase family protein [Verrucomicrobia bacterium]|nr:CotH kinase family protein [Verrucomicrobiota bacterium]